MSDEVFDELKEQIRRVEALFQADGRFTAPAYIKMPTRMAELRWAKLQGKWRILVRYPYAEVPLEETSMATRKAAASHLDALWTAAESAYRNQIVEAQRAVQQYAEWKPPTKES